MKKTLTTGLIVTLALPALVITGCQTAPKIPPDMFTATYNLAEEGRTISISGNSDGMPGEKAEYLLKINNGAERWEDEFCVLLLDSDSVIQEIWHKRLDIPGGDGIQEPIMVEYPKGYEGPIGLAVVIPQRGSLIDTLSIGVKDAISTGWPDIRSCPSDLTQETD